MTEQRNKCLSTRPNSIASATAEKRYPINTPLCVGHCALTWSITNNRIYGQRSAARPSVAPPSTKYELNEAESAPSTICIPLLLGSNVSFIHKRHSHKSPTLTIRLCPIARRPRTSLQADTVLAKLLIGEWWSWTARASRNHLSLRRKPVTIGHTV